MQVAGWTVIGDIRGDGPEPLLLAEDGAQQRGVLRALDSEPFTAGGAEERVRDLIVELDGLAGHPGILRTLDLVEAGGTWYLVTEPQGGPPLGALLAASANAARLGAWGGDDATAAAVLIDAGLVCLALHGAGLAHGTLGEDTVVLDLDARARLRDPGLAAALADADPDLDADTRAFGALVRRVRRAWVPRGDRFGDALDRAAELAAPEPGTPDLDRAVDEIRRAAKNRLSGWEQRPRLVRAVTAWRSTQPAPVPFAPPTPAAPAAAALGATFVDAPEPAPAAPAATMADPPETSAALATGATVVDPPAPPATAPLGAATMIDPPPSDASLPASDSVTVADAPPAAPDASPPAGGPRYRLGAMPPPEAPPATAPPPPPPPPAPPEPAPAPVSGPIRIGAPPVAIAGAAGAGAAAAPAWPVVSPRRRRRRLLGAAGIVVAAVVIALVLVVLLHGHAGESVLRVVRVRVSTGTPHLSCGGQAVVNGVITTNGAEGAVRYQWSRSDGVATDGSHTQGVPSGATSVPVSFALSVTGPGTLSEEITLNVLSPARLGPFTTTVDYSCTGG